jgi:hypothetical protein
MKPIHSHEDEQVVCRAAREKIAADLAHDLGVPVPPVQLTTRSDGRNVKPVAVSLVMYPRQWAWEQVKTQPVGETVHGAALVAILAQATPMLAFDTWLAQTDHGDHPHNIVWGYDPASMANAGLIFLDYSFSMGYSGGWKDGHWRTVEMAPFPALLLQHLDRSALRDTIQKIEAYPAEVIREVVGRLPDSHMPPPQRDLLQEALIGRKSLLKDCLQRLL